MDLDRPLHELLMESYEIDTGLIPPNISSFKDVLKNYHDVNRMLRQIANTRALEEKNEWSRHRYID